MTHPNTEVRFAEPGEHIFLVSSSSISIGALRSAKDDDFQEATHNDPRDPISDPDLTVPSSYFRLETDCILDLACRGWARMTGVGNSLK